MTTVRMIAPERTWKVGRVPIAALLDEVDRDGVTNVFKVWAGDHPACRVEMKCQFLQDDTTLALRFSARPGTDVLEALQAFEGVLGPMGTLCPLPSPEVIGDEFVYLCAWWVRVPLKGGSS